MNFSLKFRINFSLKFCHAEGFCFVVVKAIVALIIVDNWDGAYQKIISEIKGHLKWEKGHMYCNITNTVYGNCHFMDLPL